MEWIIDIVVTGFAVWLAAIILPGVTLKNIFTGFWVALLLAIINGTLGWLLKLITTPLNWITFGLVHFIVNVLMIMLVDKIIPGFHIKNFLNAIIFAILISLVSSLINWII